MNKLTAARQQSDGRKADCYDAVATAETDADASRMVARVRRLMIISGLTTLIAIAAVVGVIGYRVYRAGESVAGAQVGGMIALPKGARVLAAAVAGERVVVTLDIGGSTEIRTYDIRTLKEVGRLSFATEP